MHVNIYTHCCKNVNAYILYASLCAFRYVLYIMYILYIIYMYTGKYLAATKTAASQILHVQHTLTHTHEHFSKYLYISLCIYVCECVCIHIGWL